MTIKQIIEEESSNSSEIILRKEGLFWRAYELSAFLFIHMIKEYKAVKRNYKVIGRDVVLVFAKVFQESTSIHWERS